MLSSFGKTLFARLWEDPVNVQETSRRQLTRARQETVRRALGVWEGRDRFPSGEGGREFQRRLRVVELYLAARVPPAP